MDYPADVENENCTLITQVRSTGDPFQPFENGPQRLDDDILLTEKVIYHESESLLGNAHHNDKEAVRVCTFRIQLEKTVKPEKRKRTLPELHDLFSFDRQNVLFIKHD